MNDRELLERAAKIAGIHLYIATSAMGGCIGLRVNGGGIWNPLTNDGDAFRLMVDLGLDLDRTAEGWLTVRQVQRCLLTHSVLVTVDPRSATRRAIVRAAALLAVTK